MSNCVLAMQNAYRLAGLSRKGSQVFEAELSSNSGQRSVEELSKKAKGEGKGKMGLPLEERIDEGVVSEGEQKGRPREDTAAVVEGGCYDQGLGETLAQHENETLLSLFPKHHQQQVF